MTAHIQTMQLLMSVFWCKFQSGIQSESSYKLPYWTYGVMFFGKFWTFLKNVFNNKILPAVDCKTSHIIHGRQSPSER